MHGPMVAERITPLDGIDELVHAPAAGQSRREGAAVLAVAVLGEHHARMVRAEVGAVFARKRTAGR